MILVLLALTSGGLDRFLSLFPASVHRRLGRALRVTSPAALGTTFEQQ
jgi:hypothetical protein